MVTIAGSRPSGRARVAATGGVAAGVGLAAAAEVVAGAADEEDTGRIDEINVIYAPVEQLRVGEQSERSEGFSDQE